MVHRVFFKLLMEHLGAWLVLALALAATGVGWHYAVQAGLEEARRSVAQDADRITWSITARVQSYEQILLGAAALVVASDQVTAAEWRRYVTIQRIAERFPEVQSIGFAEHVEQRDLPALVERRRADGDAAFAVRPPGARPVYTPVIFSEPPVVSGESTLGHDLFDDTTRWQAIMQAMSVDRPTLTSRRPIASPLSTRSITQLEIYAPAKRDGEFLGVAFAPLDVDEFIRAVVAPAASDIVLLLYDGTAASRAAATPNGLWATMLPGPMRELRTFAAGGRLWTAEILAPGRSASAATRLVPLLVLTGGATISMLLFMTLRTLDRARRGERRFRDYAQMATDWLWEHDRNLRFTFFVKSTGGMRADVTPSVVGKTRRSIAERIGDPEELTSLNRMEELMRAGHRFAGFEYSIVKRGGEREHFRISAKPLRDLFGRIRGYRGITQVVTGEKRRERDLRDAKAAAEAASASKSRFLAMMSHELRTPLNAIIGFSEVIADQRFGPSATARYVDYARIIHSSGQQLLELISQLLDMSKIEAGRLEMYYEDVNLAEVVEDCCRLLQNRASEGGVTLAAEIGAAAPIVHADRRALRQITLNLVANAIKFTPGGGCVRLSLDIGPDGAVGMTVADTGIGISEEALARIFQPFQQADSSIARRFGGTGLGLAISRALVEAHGGTLTLESKLGAGTIARLYLPSRRIVADTTADRRAAPSIAAVAD
ncbi:MAG: CHASE domain-containing protein [Alphaproteobacteria bacterium]|nr:CHASE domain-containing protein [Alphaproteobacteria bacterium]